MEPKANRAQADSALDIDSAARFIEQTQLQSGEIPWHTGGKTDPWDHVEAAMGLSIGGCHEAARRAYEWLAKNQLEDGSWYSAYRDGIPEDTTRETHLAAYIAVGVFHYYLSTGDIDLLYHMWKPVKRAIDFAINLQAPGGEIFWAMSPQNKVDPMALMTGSSSIYMSIKCAISIATQLNQATQKWKSALNRLENAIKYKPHLFNMTKARYAMDWFYPILCGVITGSDARKRLNRFWKKFVINAQGARCVSDRHWVTVAETAELSLALSALGDHALSEITFSWIFDRRYEDGTYWCGFTLPDIVLWPDDKLTWTNAAVMMAADALYHLTPAGKLFNHRFWLKQNLL